MKSLDSAAVAITGAGSGLGRGLALECARRGARVAVSDIDTAGLAQTVQTAADEGLGSLHAQRLDVTDREAVRSWAAQVRGEFGAVNAIINNAGVSYSGPITEIEYDDFEWLMNINFWGVVYGTKEFLPHLIESGRGHIVNISSLFGLVAMPGQSTYNAAKFAVRGFTESVRQDMLVAGLPVAVTCVHPGGIKTGIARNGRSTRPEEHAATAALFDEQLARLTPQQAATIVIDGMLREAPRVLVGADARLVHSIGTVLGARYQDLYATIARRRLP